MIQIRGLRSFFRETNDLARQLKDCNLDRTGNGHQDMGHIGVECNIDRSGNGYRDMGLIMGLAVGGKVIQILVRVKDTHSAG
jgi:hypothetical protein